MPSLARRVLAGRAAQCPRKCPRRRLLATRGQRPSIGGSAPPKAPCGGSGHGDPFKTRVPKLRPLAKSGPATAPAPRAKPRGRTEPPEPGGPLSSSQCRGEHRPAAPAPSASLCLAAGRNEPSFLKKALSRETKPATSSSFPQTQREYQPVRSPGFAARRHYNKIYGVLNNCQVKALKSPLIEKTLIFNSGKNATVI